MVKLEAKRCEVSNNVVIKIRNWMEQECVECGVCNTLYILKYPGDGKPITVVKMKSHKAQCSAPVLHLCT